MSDPTQGAKRRKLALDLHEFRIACRKLESQAEEIENSLIEVIGEDLRSGAVHDTRTTPES